MGSFYNSYSKFLKEKFSTEVHKISLSSNATCPNRDGTLGTGGCIYCSELGSGRIYAKTPYEQARDYFDLKIPGKEKYIAYFQSFSNMYKNKEVLIESIEKIMTLDDVVGFSVSTRPDSLDKDILECLKSISDRYFIQIEMGLESSNDKTLERINRKMGANKYLYAVEQVRNTIPEAHIVCHVILGLPEEKYSDYENTIEFYVKSDSDGIKFHHLYVHKNTELNRLFEEGRTQVMDEYEYIECLLKLLEKIPSEKVIHRLKSSLNPNDLIAPLWTLDKHFYEKLSSSAREKKSYQGKYYGNNRFNCW